MTSPYQSGDLVRVTAAFTDGASGVALDPTTVTLRVWQAGTVGTTYTYGTGTEIVRDATGTYHANIDTSGAAAGTSVRWYYAWASTGIGQAAQVGTFIVLGTPV